MLRIPLLAALLAGSAACSADPPPGREATTSTVELGVPVLESHAAAWDRTPARAWRLAHAPLLDLGDERAPFGDVISAVRLSDGRLAVADRLHHQVRFFSRDGRPLGAVGGRGFGPAEFGEVASLVRGAGDTLLLSDVSNARVAFVAPTPAVARTVPAPRWQKEGSLIVVGRFPDGGLLYRTMMAAHFPPRTAVFRDQVTLVRYDPGAGTARAIARLAGDELVATFTARGVDIFRRPFGLTTSVAVAGDSVFAGTGALPEVTVLDREGAPRRVLRWVQARAPVTAAEAARVHREKVEEAEPRYRPSLQRALAELPPPDRKPVYTRLRVDPSGHLWVEDGATTPPAPGRWRVFDSRGVLLGSVSTPPRFTVTEVGADYVVGTRTDDLGVEHVQAFALLKPQ